MPYIAARFIPLCRINAITRPLSEPVVVFSFALVTFTHSLEQMGDRLARLGEGLCWPLLKALLGLLKVELSL